MEDWRESENLKFAYTLHWPTCFSGSLGWRFSRECLLEFVTGIIGCWGGRMEKVCRGNWRWGLREWGGHNRGSATEGGVTQGRWIWRREGRGGDAVRLPLPLGGVSVSFQGVSAGVGGWNDGMHGGKEG